MPAMDNFNKQQNVFSKTVRAGKRRTYFIDVKETRSSDYFISITESKRVFDSDEYTRHKIHLYKEDFNKFIQALTEASDHVKTLLPDFDFDAFSKEENFSFGDSEE